MSARVDSGDWLDNRPFRDLCLRTIARNGTDWSEISRRAGYGQGDCSRLQRAIGLRVGTGRSTGKQQRYVSYEVAVRIVRACDAYPVDYGV